MPVNQPTLLEPDAAYAVVQQRVYAPVFFNKLASDYGVRPANSEEAAAMLKMASQLREAHEQQEQAVAAAGNPLLKAAQQHLDRTMGAVGLDSSRYDNDLIEKAAAEVAYDPTVAHAVLSLQAQVATQQQR